MDVVYKVFIQAVDLSIFGHVLCGLDVELLKCGQVVSLSFLFLSFFLSNDTVTPATANILF